MTRLVYSTSAENDLLEAWLFVAENSLAAADRLVEQIEAEAMALVDRPLSGRPRNELAVNLRSWSTSTPYILYYFASEQGISVARVLHHVRDVPAIGTWPIG